MLITKAISKKLITGIIAPHGMTDLIHAVQNKNVPYLKLINLGSFLSSFAIYSLNNRYFDYFFYIISAIHFRHDFPKIKNLPRVFLSVALLTFFATFNSNLFLFYMVLVHVPNHYRINWNYLKKDKLFTVVILTFFTYLLLYFGEKKFIYNKELETLYKGLILSHIVYQEVFIFKSLKNIGEYFEKQRIRRLNYEI